MLRTPGSAVLREAQVGVVDPAETAWGSSSAKHLAVAVFQTVRTSSGIYRVVRLCETKAFISECRPDSVFGV